MTIEIVLNTNVLVIRSFNKSPQNYIDLPFGTNSRKWILPLIAELRSGLSILKKEG